MYYSKIGVKSYGLTNQIFALITSIILAYRKKENIIVVDNFLNDYSKESYSPVSEVLDLEQLNIFLKEKYNITLVDKESSNEYKNKKYIVEFGWIDKYDTSMFEDIIVNIKYNTSYIEKSKIILSKERFNPSKVNIIHLRIEDDAIKHWAKMNKLPQIVFKDYIENKYITLIDKYISKEDTTIILSSSLKNKVIDFLSANSYNYMINEKYFEEREKNAIVDLLTSQLCNNIFIGNYNPVLSRGSTFSYYISKMTKATNICIDLDSIYDDEYIMKN
jgi:hypothetical protein